MPFTAQEISDAGLSALDFYLKNNPIDQIAVERPLLKKLMAKKQEFPGARENVVEQIRTRYQSNFQWFRGDGIVTYNKRQSLDQASYPWQSAHDGLALDEDRMAQNGIIVTDSGDGKRASRAEIMQLTNLFTEQMEILRLGFEEKMSEALHLDGTQDPDAITGLDALVSLTPTTGVVGGIDRANVTSWRNHVATGLTTTTSTGTIQDKMEIAWRACVRSAQGRPDCIIVGSDFLDGFRNFMLKTYGQVNYGPVSEMEIEGGTKSMTFHGVPLEWSPEFADLDDVYSPGTPWEKRCYFLNSRFIKLRPMEGQDMRKRRPARPHDRYEHYWAITWRGALTMSQSNAHAVLALA